MSTLLGVVLTTFLRWYYRMALRVCLRRIESDGQDDVPRELPLILAPNHLNSLVDPLVVEFRLPRRLTITALAKIVRKPLYGKLMKIGGVVIFHRSEDRGLSADRLGNQEAVAECKRRLDRGEALCIFPEGTSHSDPILRPFKQGVARIALEYAGGNGPRRPLAIVPVGQTYDIKADFRSSVLVRYGKPLDVVRWIEENPQGGRLELTAEIEQRVRALTPDFRRRRDPLLISWAADLLGLDGRDVDPLTRPARLLGNHCRLMRQLRSGLGSEGAICPEGRANLTRRLRSHRIALRRLGLEPSDVYLYRAPWRTVRFLVLELAFAPIGVPIVIWGSLNHALLYVSLRAIARKLSRKRNVWLSNALYFSILVLPLCYALQIGAAWILLSPIGAVCYALLLPATGYLALPCQERIAAVWRRGIALVRLLPNPTLHRRLRDESDALRAELARCCGDVGPPSKY